VPCPSYGRCTNGGDPMTSTPTPEPGPHSRACGWRPHDHGSACSTNCPTCHGRPAPSTPGEGAGRPGGWVEGIGWVALLCDLAPGDVWAPHLPPAQPTHVVGMRHNGTMGASVPFSPSVVIITRWADGTTPQPPVPPQGGERPDTDTLRKIGAGTDGDGITLLTRAERAFLARAADWIDAQPPASPADDVPDADAVAFQNGYQIGVRVGSEHHGPCRGLPPASPVPPTPTPCPYIVTGGEGTSYCSLAERSAMHAAAPPSTPADPRPTDPTGSEA